MSSLCRTNGAGGGHLLIIPPSAYQPYINILLRLTLFKFSLNGFCGLCIGSRDLTFKHGLGKAEVLPKDEFKINCNLGEHLWHEFNCNLGTALLFDLLKSRKKSLFCLQ